MNDALVWMCLIDVTWNFMVTLGEETLQYLVYPCKFNPLLDSKYFLLNSMIKKGKMINAIPEHKDFDRRFINRPPGKKDIINQLY